MGRGAADLDASPPMVTVAAAYSKRRRNDEQPIRQDLAELVRPWLAVKTKGSPVLHLLHGHTAELIRHDLQAAGIPYADDAGRVADFHALRHTFITRVVSSGASVKAAQELARHSTPSLTIGRYAHVRLHDLSAALDALPDTDKTENDREELRATGTADEAAHNHPLRYPQRVHEAAQTSAVGRNEQGAKMPGEASSDPPNNMLKMRKLRNEAPRHATPCVNAGGGTRTHTRGEPERILNPSRLPIPPHRPIEHGHSCDARACRQTRPTMA